MHGKSLLRLGWVERRESTLQSNVTCNSREGSKKIFLRPSTDYTDFLQTLLCNLWLVWLQIFVEPVEHGVIPQLRVLRLQYPVTFVRKDQKFGVDAFLLHGGEQLHCLTDRHAIVQLAVNNENGRAEVLHEAVRRP